MKNNKKAYSEILAFLKIVDSEYVKKIPQNLIKVFENEKDKEYFPQYNLETPIEEQYFEKETRELIALLYLNYWYESEEDKKELEEIYSSNTIKYEKELREKYNPDNIFKNKNREEDKEETVAIIEYKESIFKKILNKIKSIFKK